MKLPLVVSIAGSDEAIRDFLQIAQQIDRRLTFDNAHWPARSSAGVISLHWRLEGKLQCSEATLEHLLSGEAAPAYRATLLMSPGELEEEADRWIKETAKRRAIARKQQLRLPMKRKR